MKAGEADRYLRYLGYDSKFLYRVARRGLPSSKCLVVGAFVICLLLLTAVAIYAVRSGKPSIGAPEAKQSALTDEARLLSQDIIDDATYMSESMHLLPRTSHPECYGEWYCLFAAIAQLLAVR